MLSTVNFENGLFIIAERVVTYDAIYWFAGCLGIVAIVFLFSYIATRVDELLIPFSICLTIALFMVMGCPEPYKVVDAIVDFTTPWSEISERYELISVKDVNKSIYTFKVLKEEKSDACTCSCNCKK